MGEGSQEFQQPEPVPVINSEEVKVNTQEKKSGFLGDFVLALRRKLGRSEHTETKPKEEPQIPLEQLKQDLKNLQDIRNRGGSDFNTPQTRAQDDKRMEELSSMIAAREPKQELPTIPASPALTPDIQAVPSQPATEIKPEEQKVA